MNTPCVATIPSGCIVCAPCAPAWPPRFFSASSSLKGSIRLRARPCTPGLPSFRKMWPMMCTSRKCAFLVRWCCPSAKIPILRRFPARAAFLWWTRQPCGLKRCGGVIPSWRPGALPSPWPVASIFYRAMTCKARSTAVFRRQGGLRPSIWPSCRAVSANWLKIRPCRLTWNKKSVQRWRVCAPPASTSPCVWCCVGGCGRLKPVAATIPA